MELFARLFNSHLVLEISGHSHEYGCFHRAGKFLSDDVMHVSRDE